MGAGKPTDQGLVRVGTIRSCRTPVVSQPRSSSPVRPAHHEVREITPKAVTTLTRRTREICDVPLSRIRVIPARCPRTRPSKFGWNSTSTEASRTCSRTESAPCSPSGGRMCGTSKFRFGQALTILRSGGRSCLFSKERRRNHSTDRWRRTSSHWTLPTRSIFGPGGPSNSPRITRKSTKNGGNPKGPEPGHARLDSQTRTVFSGVPSPGPL